VQGDCILFLSSYKWVATESQLFVHGLENQIQNLKPFKFKKKHKKDDVR
jgi:hypothetical protein